MGIGIFEICIIALFALIFFGPQRLPEVMKDLGKFFVHAKRLSNEVNGHFESIMNEAEASIAIEEKKALAKQKNTPPVPPNTEPHNTEATPESVIFTGSEKVPPHSQEHPPLANAPHP